MSHLLSPGTVLALVLTLMVAQATRVVAPDRGPYLWQVSLAAVGLIVGELLALSGLFQGPAVGVLHPAVDVVVMAVVELAGVLVVAPRHGLDVGN